MSLIPETSIKNMLYAAEEVATELEISSAEVTKRHDPIFVAVSQNISAKTQQILRKETTAKRAFDEIQNDFDYKFMKSMCKHQKIYEEFFHREMPNPDEKKNSPIPRKVVSAPATPQKAVRSPPIITRVVRRKHVDDCTDEEYHKAVTPEKLMRCARELQKEFEEKNISIQNITQDYALTSPAFKKLLQEIEDDGVVFTPQRTNSLLLNDDLCEESLQFPLQLMDAEGSTDNSFVSDMSPPKSTSRRRKSIAKKIQF